MKTLIISSIFSLFFLIQYAQNPGDLNLGFGSDGIYIADWEDTISNANSIGILSDGSIITAGLYISSVSEAVTHVLKLNDNGNPVQFGNFSRGFEFNFSEDESESAVALYVLPDDKILIAGHYYKDPDYYPFVIRLLSNGTLDEDFGDHGVYTDESIDMEVSTMEVYQLESSYKIILGGYSCSLANPQLLMIDGEGMTDPAFGTGGIILFTESLGYFSSIDIDSKNNFLFASGKTYPAYGTIITKYSLPEGSIVTDFGDDGFLIYSETEGFVGAVNASVLDTTDNTLTVFGDYRYTAGDYDIFAYRMHASDGTPDKTFGVDGWSSLRSESSIEHIFTAILQSDGKYYFGGCSDISGSRDFLLGRLNHNGLADKTFGNNGFVLTTMGGHENLMSLALSPAEDILYAGGYYYYDLVYDEAIVVAAYHTGYEVVTPVETMGNESPAFTVYPNPSAGIVNIKTGFTGGYQVKVFDLAGKELFNESFLEGSIELNLELLQPSVYLMYVVLPDGQTIMNKLIML